MSKIKLLLDVIADLRGLADSLQAMADAWTDDEHATSEEVACQPSVQADTAPPADAIPLEKVRAALAVKSQDGFGAEIRALLQKYGAEKLSAVDPTHYAALLADTEAIGHE